MTLKMQIHKIIGKSTDPYMNIIIFLNSIVIYGIQPSILCTFTVIVKLRRGSGKDRQGMAPKAKGLKA